MRLVQGIMRMSWGFFEKLVIASRLGIFVDAAFAENHGGWVYTCLRFWPKTTASPADGTMKP